MSERDSHRNRKDHSDAHRRSHRRDSSSVRDVEQRRHDDSRHRRSSSRYHRSGSTSSESSVPSPGLRSRTTSSSKSSKDSTSSKQINKPSLSERLVDGALDVALAAAGFVVASAVIGMNSKDTRPQESSRLVHKDRSEHRTPTHPVRSREDDREHRPARREEPLQSSLRESPEVKAIEAANDMRHLLPHGPFDRCESTLAVHDGDTGRGFQGPFRPPPVPQPDESSSPSQSAEWAVIMASRPSVRSDSTLAVRDGDTGRRFQGPFLPPVALPKLDENQPTSPSADWAIKTDVTMERRHSQIQRQDDVTTVAPRQIVSRADTDTRYSRDTMPPTAQNYQTSSAPRTEHHRERHRDEKEAEAKRLLADELRRAKRNETTERGRPRMTARSYSETSQRSHRSGTYSTEEPFDHDGGARLEQSRSRSRRRRASGPRSRHRDEHEIPHGREERHERENSRNRHDREGRKERHGRRDREESQDPDERRSHRFKIQSSRGSARERSRSKTESKDSNPSLHNLITVELEDEAVRRRGPKERSASRVDRERALAAYHSTAAREDADRYKKSEIPDTRGPWGDRPFPLRASTGPTLPASSRSGSVVSEVRARPTVTFDKNTIFDKGTLPRSLFREFETSPSKRSERVDCRGETCTHKTNKALEMYEWWYQSKNPETSKTLVSRIDALQLYLTQLRSEFKDEESKYAEKSQEKLDAKLESKSNEGLGPNFVEDLRSDFQRQFQADSKQREIQFQEDLRAKFHAELNTTLAEAVSSGEIFRTKSALSTPACRSCRKEPHRSFQWRSYEDTESSRPVPTRSSTC